MSKGTLLLLLRSSPVLHSFGSEDRGFVEWQLYPILYDRKAIALTQEQAEKQQLTVS